MKRSRRRSYRLSARQLVTQMEPLEQRQMLSAINHLRIPASDKSKAAKVRKDAAYTQYQIFNPAEDPVANPNGVSAPQGRTPAQVRKSYGLDSVVFGSVTGDGTGQTIAIVDAYDDPSFVSDTDPNYGISDLVRFDNQFSLPHPPSFKKVNQSGGTSYPAYDAGWAGEIALDVEWVHAMAPKAGILLVEASSSSLSALNAAVNYAKAQPGVTAVSMSYGTNDFSGESSFASVYTTPAGHPGVTFIASSGDAGGVLQHPSSSPNVLGVGGTHLNQADSTGTYSSESAWNGSGGGISANEVKPSYQNIITTPSTTQRSAPDVAAVADPNTGVAVLDSSATGIGSANPWVNGYIGGTSLSAPMWAGFMAIANQGRSLLGLGSLDGRSQTLPRLYTLPQSDYHDITSGTAGSFSASTGYDLISGRGSPRTNLLLKDLAGGSNISGSLFQDNNGSGTLDGGETGISGASVFLDLNNNGALDSAYEPRTTTSANGTYSFSDVVGGTTFNIRVTAPANFVATTSALTSTTTYGATNGNVNFGLFPTTFTGSAFTLQMDASATKTQIFTSGTPTGSPAYSVAKSALTTLTFNGTSGADVLNVDLTNGVPIPGGSVTYAGVNGADSVVVTGSAGADTVGVSGSDVMFGTLAVHSGGVGSISVNLGGGNDTLNFSAPTAAVSFNPGTGSDTLNVLSGTYTASTDLGAGGSKVTVNVSAGATASFGSTQHLATLSLPSGADANVQANGTRVLVISSAADISGTGTLDLNDNDLLIFGSGLLPTVQNLVNSGRSNGTWSGVGITTSAAQNRIPRNTGLATMTEAQYQAINGAAATFDGQALTSPAVIVKYTYYGDTDFNGVVDFDDYSRTDAGFNQGNTGWVNGDFDGNGVVDFDDYSLIDLAFNSQVGIL